MSVALKAMLGGMLGVTPLMTLGVALVAPPAHAQITVYSEADRALTVAAELPFYIQYSSNAANDDSRDTTQAIGAPSVTVTLSGRRSGIGRYDIAYEINDEPCTYPQARFERGVWQARAGDIDSAVERAAPAIERVGPAVFEPFFRTALRGGNQVTARTYTPDTGADARIGGGLVTDDLIITATLGTRHQHLGQGEGGGACAANAYGETTAPPEAPLSADRRGAEIATGVAVTLPVPGDLSGQAGAGLSYTDHTRDVVADSRGGSTFTLAANAELGLPNRITLESHLTFEDYSAGATGNDAYANYGLGAAARYAPSDRVEVGLSYALGLRNAPEARDETRTVLQVGAGYALFRAVTLQADATSVIVTRGSDEGDDLGVVVGFEARI